MDKEKNEKHLDELISRAINTERPQFDAGKWKQKYPDEYQALISRASEKAPTHQPNIWRITLRNPIIRIAAAAVIIVAIGLIVLYQEPSEQVDTTTFSKVTKSPAELITAMSLERAFRHGGIEAVENQCREAFKPTGPVTGILSIEQILEDFNGNGNSTERTRL